MFKSYFRLDNSNILQLKKVVGKSTPFTPLKVANYIINSLITSRSVGNNIREQMQFNRFS